MCTYCSGINGVVLSAIAMAWKGEPWDKVEVLTGKKMKPTPGMNTTILLGKCMYQANKDHPDIKNLLAVKGCPPKPDQILAALHQAGVMVDENLFKHIESLPGFFMKRYEGKPEYDEDLFRVA
jgi:Ni,Fe-hydrogenase III small subunit